MQVFGLFPLFDFVAIGTGYSPHAASAGLSSHELDHIFDENLRECVESGLEVLCASHRVSSVQGVEDRTYLRHCKPLAVIDFKMYLGFFNNLGEGILAAAVFVVQKGGDDVGVNSLFGVLGLYNKMLFQGRCQGHLAHSNQTPPTGIRINILRNTWYFPIREPDKSVKVLQCLRPTRKPLPQNIGVSGVLHRGFANEDTFELLHASSEGVCEICATINCHVLFVDQRFFDRCARLGFDARLDVRSRPSSCLAGFRLVYHFLARKHFERELL